MSIDLKSFVMPLERGAPSWHLVAEHSDNTAAWSFDEGQALQVKDRLGRHPIHRTGHRLNAYAEADARPSNTENR